MSHIQARTVVKNMWGEKSNTIAMLSIPMIENAPCRTIFGTIWKGNVAQPQQRYALMMHRMSPIPFPMKSLAAEFEARRK